MVRALRWCLLAALMSCGIWSCCDHGHAKSPLPPSSARGALANSAATQIWQPPAYVDRTRFAEREIRVGVGRWQVDGTLTIPREPGQSSAVVVLVHGSGPQDRDQTLGPNKPFKDLAWGLASRGIAVLRYEKRTRQHGAAVRAHFRDSLTLKEETVDDAIAAVDSVRAHPETAGAQIFVLGYSLGGSAIPRIARRDRAIGGFVIMAGAAQPFEESLVKQLEHVVALDGKVSTTERQILDKLRAQAERVKVLVPGGHVEPGQLPLDLPGPYWLDLKANPPTQLLQDERRPFLVVQGGRDYQVTARDLAIWRRALAQAEATFMTYPRLNHLFAAGTGLSSPTEYQRPGHVAAAVLRDVAAWIHRHASSS